jgi:hypothetical protein
VELADQLIRLLDRDVHVGLAHLRHLDLDVDECQAVADLMPRVAAQVASFEAAMPVGQHTLAPSSSLSPQASVNPSWPVDFEVLAKNGATYRAYAVAPNTFEVEGRDAQVVNQLTRVTLACPGETLVLWVNVTSCELTGRGFRLQLKPFGLDGAARSSWIALLSTVRSGERAAQAD